VLATRESGELAALTQPTPFATDQFARPNGRVTPHPATIFHKTEANSAERPTLGRVSIDSTVQLQLDALDVPYEIFPCDPALADTANFCAAYGFKPEDSANTILVIGKSDPPVYAACVVLSNTRLDVNKTVRQRLGTRKASFAPAEETRAITGMEIGGVTVFGLPPELPIWVDSRVVARARIVLGGGSRSSKVIAAPEILLKLPRAEVVDGLATEAVPSS
jgi:prolyl-tRNA editing enzyme YbaK/EbsC (Cys-tRNA(Pro) deacylase)